MGNTFRIIGQVFLTVVAVDVAIKAYRGLASVGTDAANIIEAKYRNRANRALEAVGADPR